MERHGAQGDAGAQRALVGVHLATARERRPHVLPDEVRHLGAHGAVDEGDVDAGAGDPGSMAGAQT